MERQSQHEAKRSLASRFPSTHEADAAGWFGVGGASLRTNDPSGATLREFVHPRAVPRHHSCEIDTGRGVLLSQRRAAHPEPPNCQSRFFGTQAQIISHWMGSPPLSSLTVTGTVTSPL